MRKLTEEQQIEIQQIRDWSLVILEYFGKNSQPGVPTFHVQIATIIEREFNASNLRGLRLVFKDLKEWAKGLNKVRYAELNEVLMQKFGKDLFTKKISHSGND
jgi:hypothetical protein